MRAFLTGLMLCAVHQGWSNQELLLTNNVLIGGSNVFLSITDEPMSKESVSDVPDMGILSDAPLSWIIRNTSTNSFAEGVLFLGVSKSFSIRLLDSSGHPLQMTDAGEAFLEGPSDTNQFGITKPKRVGVSGQSIQLRELPSLTNLFVFGDASNCVAEVQYWLWHPTNHYWHLSKPVRLRVEDTWSSPPHDENKPTQMRQ